MCHGKKERRRIIIIIIIRNGAKTISLQALFGRLNYISGRYFQSLGGLGLSLALFSMTEIFWADIYIGENFFLGPNLVSFNQTVVPYAIS
jgi:hypothetical protein